MIRMTPSAPTPVRRSHIAATWFGTRPHAFAEIEEHQEVVPRPWVLLVEAAGLGPYQGRLGSCVLEVRGGLVHYLCGPAGPGLDFIARAGHAGTKPSVLRREVLRPSHRPLLSLLQGEPTLEVPRQLRVADRLRRGEPSAESTLQQALHLVELSARDHGRNPLAMRRASASGSMWTPTARTCAGSHGATSPPNALKGVPVIAATSSARTTCRTLAGSILAAATGSRCPRRRYSVARQRPGLLPRAPSMAGGLARELEVVHHRPVEVEPRHRGVPPSIDLRHRGPERTTGTGST